MKNYKVTLHMNNGNYLYLNDITAENDKQLLDIIFMNSNTSVPIESKFGRSYSGDHIVCYCVGQISSVHYKEID